MPQYHSFHCFHSSTAFPVHTEAKTSLPHTLSGIEITFITPIITVDTSDIKLLYSYYVEKP